MLVGFVIPAEGEFVGGGSRDSRPGAMRDAGLRFGFEIEEREQTVEIGGFGGLRRKPHSGGGEKGEQVTAGSFHRGITWRCAADKLKHVPQTLEAAFQA